MPGTKEGSGESGAGIPGPRTSLEAVRRIGLIVSLGPLIPRPIILICGYPLNAGDFILF